MKALALVRISKLQNQFEFCVQQFGWKNIVKVFLCFFFLQVCYFSGEHFNSCTIFHGRLKACEIFLCVKLKCEKIKSMVLMKADSA